MQEMFGVLGGGKMNYIETKVQELIKKIDEFEKRVEDLETKIEAELSEEVVAESAISNDQLIDKMIEKIREVIE